MKHVLLFLILLQLFSQDRHDKGFKQVEKGRAYIVTLHLPTYFEMKSAGKTKADYDILFRQSKTAIMSYLKRDQKQGKSQEFKLTFSGFCVDLTPGEVSILKQHPMVKDVILDGRVNANLEESVPLIGAPLVWEQMDQNMNKIRGQGQVIAILDTGVDYNHPDLGGCFGPDCKVIGGYDFINDDVDPMDDHGHGTHVAGIAAGNGQGSEGKILGVAPDAKIMAFKVLGENGSGRFSNLISGIEACIDPNGDGDPSDHVDVANLSIGGPGSADDLVCLSVDAAVEAGVVMVVSAGNNPESISIQTPGLSRKAITVGASTHLKGQISGVDELAPYSSKGPAHNHIHSVFMKPDILAPGGGLCLEQRCFDEGDSAIYAEGVLSCNLGGIGGDLYVRKSGTSMAAPHVAGAAALLKQSHPDWEPTEIKFAFMATALDLGYAFEEQGNGRIQVFDADKVPVLVQPAALRFEKITAEHPVNKDVWLRNPGQTPVEIHFSAQNTIDGTEIQLPEPFTLQPNEPKKVNIGLSLTDEIALNEAKAGIIQIWVGEDSYPIRYSFYGEGKYSPTAFAPNLGQKLVQVGGLLSVQARLGVGDFDQDETLDFMSSHTKNVHFEITTAVWFYSGKEPDSSKLVYATTNEKISEDSSYADNNIAIVPADFDGDGWTDVAIGGVLGNVHILFNRTYEHFEPQIIELENQIPLEFGGNIFLADWADGFLKLNGTSSQFPGITQRMSINQDAPVLYRNYTITPQSFDADGVLRLELSHSGFEPVFLGNLGQTAYGLCVFDADLDGDVDLFSTYSFDGDYSQRIVRFENLGERKFAEPIEVFAAPGKARFSDLVAGDFDGDGQVDILAGWSETVNGIFDHAAFSLFQRNPNGAWLDSGKTFYLKTEDGGLDFNTARVHPKLAAADFDLDSDLDLAVGDNSGKVAVFENDGHGRFVHIGDVQDFGARSYGIASGDFNKDAKPDLFVGAVDLTGSYDIHYKQNLFGKRGTEKPHLYHIVETPSPQEKLVVTIINPDQFESSSFDLVQFRKAGYEDSFWVREEKIKPGERKNLELDGAIHGELAWIQIGSDRELAVSWLKKGPSTLSSSMALEKSYNNIAVPHIAQNISQFHTSVKTLMPHPGGTSTSLRRMPSGSPFYLSELSAGYSTAKRAAHELFTPVSGDTWAMLTSDDAQLQSSLTFELVEGDCASLPLTQLDSEIYLPFFHDETNWTGLVYVNMTETHNQVSESYLDADGNILHFQSAKLDPWAKRVVGSWEMDSVIKEACRSVVIVPESRIQSFALTGYEKALAVIPAQNKGANRILFPFYSNSDIHLMNLAGQASSVLFEIVAQNGQIVASEVRSISAHGKITFSPVLNSVNASGLVVHISGEHSALVGWQTWKDESGMMAAMRGYGKTE